MSEIVNSISTAISLAKRLNEISKNIQNAEFKNLLAELSLELADTKLRLAEIIEENASLRQELHETKHSKGMTSTGLEFSDGVYYTEDRDGPFCPGCYDSSGKQIRLTEQKGPFRTFGKYKCPSCDEFF